MTFDSDTCDALPTDVKTPTGLVLPGRCFSPQDVSPDTPLSQLTTLRIGGPAAKVQVVTTEAQFIEAIRQADADADGDPSKLLVLGGGSNVVVADAGFDGTVVVDARQQVTVPDASACGGVTVQVSAGMPWDGFVATAVENDWMGVEALSGIPGSVGAAPVQNIGAYGQEVAETVALVTVWDRLTQSRRMFPVGDMRFGYRMSRIKMSTISPQVAGRSDGRVWGPTGRWVVLEVQFQMRPASLSRPVAYAQLADFLGVQLGQRVPSRDVRRAVVELRRSKGMVLDGADHDSWSCGSFFTNPVVDADGPAATKLPPDAPRFAVSDHTKITNIAGEAPVVQGKLKTSAAWLIDHAGFGKGFALAPDAPAALSSKHVLALTNRGGARAADVVELAAAVRDGVYARFGIELVPEPVFVNLALPALKQ